MKLPETLTCQTLRLLAVLPAVLVISACGGGGGGSSSTGQTTPILQAGMQRLYSGSATRTVVYATPTSSSPNNTLTYSFTEVQNVLQAPASAPASFDINSVYAYKVTLDPGTGTVPVSQVVDDYRNLVVTGSSQATSDVAQNSTVLNSDESANALGGGPFVQTTVTASTYTTPRPGLSYPLQTAAVLTVPQSAVQQISFGDLNLSGAAPSDGSNVAYTNARTQANDGSFSFRRVYVNGNVDSYTENSNGSASYTAVTASGSTTTTVGVPVMANGVYTIPVNRTVLSSSPSTKNYSAADWYAGAALPATPLIQQTETVVGPVSSLPTQCNGALAQPNMYEIDTTTNNLNTTNGTYSVTTTRAFSSSSKGVTVCTLTNEVSSVYAVLTGALTSTTTTQTTSLLAALNY